MSKPIEFWVALGAGILIVIERHKDKPMLSRTAIAGASGGIGYSLASDFALWTGRSEVIGVMLLTAFGYLAMDIGTALISDTALWKRLVEKRLGKD